MISAGRYYRAGKRTERRKAARYSPLAERTKLLADRMWESAQKVAAALAPDNPVDTEPLDDEEQWELLETVAMELSPMHWDDPSAIRRLYELRQKYAPDTAFPALQNYAKAADAMSRVRPDVSISPENPEFEKQARRLGMKGA